MLIDIHKRSGQQFARTHARIITKRHVYINVCIVTFSASIHHPSLHVPASMNNTASDSSLPSAVARTEVRAASGAFVNLN